MNQKITVHSETILESTGGGRPAMKRILVVDDSRPLRSMLAIMLENGGYQVEQAENGNEALKILSSDKPIDLMLTDLAMGSMDGVTLLQTIRRGKNPCPPVVICSVSSDMETIATLGRLGIRHYILKPFLTETVLSKVREVLNG